MIKLKFPFLVFVVLLVGVAFASYRGGREKIFDRPEISENKTATASASPSTAYGDLPINPGSSGVTATYIHYYFTGIIKEIKKTDTGGLIKLDTGNDKIPEINTDELTRFSKIFLPYNNSTMRPIKFEDLKESMTVDISIEYDIRTKKWIVRDVYLPDDRN